MECFQAMKDSSNFYDLRGAIGSYFMDRAFIKQFAKEYIESAVNYFRRTNKPNNELGHLINLANINIHENNFAAAGIILDRVELLNQKVKNPEFEGRLHSSYSDFYSRQQQFPQALFHAQKSYQIGKKLNVNWLEAVSLYIEGKCYHGQGKERERIKVLLECQKIVESNINLIQLKKGVYDDIQNYFFLKNDFKRAFEFSIMAQKTIENIYFSKIESDVRSFSEYNLLEKQRMVVSKIALEKQLTDIELDKLRIRQQMYLGILVLTMLFLSLLVYAFLNRRRIGRLETEELNKNLHIETLNALINGQELERVRIAQELHDGLGTMLSRTKILMGKGTTQESIIQMIDEACSEVRTISGNLQPNTLTKFGLIRALEDFVFKQNSTNPTIIFQYFGELIDLEMNKNLMIYRIIQELLTNSLKHAQANEILIQIIFSDDNLTLTVEDDGIGFDENVVNSDSSGWNNIRSRVKYLQGALNFHSEKDAGSSVTVSIPFK
jgi:signal transduction histidine kinase